MKSLSKYYILFSFSPLPFLRMRVRQDNLILIFLIENMLVAPLPSIAYSIWNPSLSPREISKHCFIWPYQLSALLPKLCRRKRCEVLILFHSVFIFVEEFPLRRDKASTVWVSVGSADNTAGTVFVSNNYFAHPQFDPGETALLRRHPFVVAGEKGRLMLTLFCAITNINRNIKLFYAIVQGKRYKVI